MSPLWRIAQSTDSGAYIIEADQVVGILSAHHDPGRAVVHEHHRRAQDLVVVGRHRVGVGAGDRGRENVTHRDIGRELRVAHEHVALLAVLAGDGHDRGRGAPTRAGRNASYRAP